MRKRYGMLKSIFVCVIVIYSFHYLQIDSSARETRDASVTNEYQNRINQVVQIPGLVAFWDFVKREQKNKQRFVAHVPSEKTNNYPLDAGNYVKDYWGMGRTAAYNDFQLLGRGPFGQAVQIRNETDENFRPFLFVPRQRLYDSPLDIKGEGKSVTLIVWAIRESGRHALAGIWHEGTDLKQKSTERIQKVERGQRQYALFAGLNKVGSACGHVSENGEASFGHIFAMHKCNSGNVSPEVPANSPMNTLDSSWQCFAMSFDNEKDEITGWLNGKATARWQEDVKNKIPPVYNAWLQGRLHSTPGLQLGEDVAFPEDQFYNPPEDKLVSKTILSKSVDERIELHEFQYSRIKVTFRKDSNGKFKVFSRDLAEIRLNPWWYPHGIYAPQNEQQGGPFTIGRVIHSARSVGFTGWIGGVAVFDRALNAEEYSTLATTFREPIALKNMR
jgi:hypothetical protein